MGDNEITADPLPVAPKPPRRDPGWGGPKGDPAGCGSALSIEQAHAALDERDVPRGAPLADRVLRYLREERTVIVTPNTDVMERAIKELSHAGYAEEAVQNFLHPDPRVAQ